MSKKKKKGLAGFLDNYNQMPDTMKTRGIHAAADIGGALAGGVIGKFAGQNAALLGLGVILTGNLTGDKSGISRAIGVGLMAYGIGKWTNDTLNKSASAEKPTVRSRLTDYKDELLGAFRLNNLFNKKTDESSEGSQSEKIPATASIGSLEALDLSVLDHFEDFNEQEANEYAMRQQSVEGTSDDVELVESLAAPAPEFSYTVIEDEDLTQF